MNLKVIRRVKRKENSQWKGAAGWSETGGRKVGENKQNGEETATRRNAEAGFVTGLQRVEIKAL